MTMLFDPLVRHDPSPAAAEEDSFSFLNRVDTPFWEEVRRVLEQWFARYPAEGALQLRERFRSRLPGQHFGASWELYLHELFTRLDYQVTLHPELADSSRRPDFQLLRGDSSLYLEAAVVFSGLAADDGELEAPGWMLDAVNHVANGNFFVWVTDVLSAGPERLKSREIVAPLTAWLESLDPDDVTITYGREGSLPHRTIACRGWEVAVSAVPIRPEARGRPDHRVLGAGPAQGRRIDDIGQLRSTLKRKAGRYGQPDRPLVTAVLSTSGFMERLDIEQALFGSEVFAVSPQSGSEPRGYRRRNGFWVRGDGPQNQRVSAVITAIGLRPWSATKVTPELWLNPWARHPLEETWPFPVATVTEAGEITYAEATPDMASILVLPSVWPGGKPFPREASGVGA